MPCGETLHALRERFHCSAQGRQVAKIFQQRHGTIVGLRLAGGDQLIDLLPEPFFRTYQSLERQGRRRTPRSSHTQYRRYHIVQNRQAEDLVAAVVRWRENPRHQERWGTDIQATLEGSHALAFPLLRLLLMRYAPAGRQRSVAPQYAACLDLLEEGITQIRYSVERNRPAAVAMAAQIQTEMAEQAFRPEMDVRAQQGPRHGLARRQAPVASRHS